MLLLIFLLSEIKSPAENYLKIKKYTLCMVKLYLTEQ